MLAPLYILNFLKSRKENFPPHISNHFSSSRICFGSTCIMLTKTSICTQTNNFSWCEILSGPEQNNMHSNELKTTNSMFSYKGNLMKRKVLTKKQP